MTTQAQPISIDVQVSVSQLQSAIATNMTLGCIVIPGPTPVVNRFTIFADYKSALASTTPGSSLDYALQAFYSQPNNPGMVAVGEIDLANDFMAEVTLIQTAAINAGSPCYGWILDKTFRDTAHQVAFLPWAMANGYFSPQVTNNDLAYNPDDVTNLAYLAGQLGGTGRLRPIYHDNAQYYPDASLMALMLGINYQQVGSTIDAQYKDLPSIPPVNITTTHLLALIARNCSTFILEGNGNRCYRDAVSAGGWYSDTVVNLDNYQNDLQTAVFNVRLQNGKVPYTIPGQMMDVSAITTVSNMYVQNGTLAPRDVPNPSGIGFKTIPAYVITPSPVGGATASMRAAHTSPPITITAYESGSMRQIKINVNAIQ